MRKIFVAATIAFLLAGLASAAVKINLKPREPEKSSKIPLVFGLTQVMLAVGGGRTNEAVSFGDISLGVKGELEGGISYKCGLDLTEVATGGAIAFKEVYLDIADFIGKGSSFRLGRFAVPFGYDFPLASEKRDYLYKAYYKNCFWSKYDFGIGNYSQAKDGSYDLALVNGEGASQDSSKSKDFSARYTIKKENMEIGLSEYLGSYNGNNRNNFGIYLKSSQGGFNAVFEYANGTDKTGTSRTLNFYSLIVQKVSEKMENVLAYESWDPNLDSGGDHILAYTFGVNVYRTADVKFTSNARLEKNENASDFSKTLLGMVQVVF